MSAPLPQGTEEPIAPTSDAPPTRAERPINAASAMQAASGLFGALGDRIGNILGLEKVAGLSLGKLLGAVPVRHTAAEAEDLFVAGTENSTPPIEQLSSDWPKPWLFSRVLLLGAAIYFLFRLAYSWFENSNLIPGLQIVGSFFVPLAVVIFYFEMNAPRNVSFYLLLKYLLLGGILSMLASLIGFSTVGKGLTWLKDSSAGPIEETGKALALLLVTRTTRYRWTLNGLLFGGIIGAGFAGFESAGYALRTLAATGSTNAMVHTISIRAYLAPGGHVVWTAIVGAALWRVKGGRKFAWSMLKDRRFSMAFAFTVVVHATWNSPIGDFGTYPVRIILTVVSWVVLFMYLQDGLGQIQQAQHDLTAPPDEATVEPAR
jgi:protease PrsW